MIFDVATIIEYLSTVTWLEPGDVIATGTPDGVGLGRKPPLYAGLSLFTVASLGCITVHSPELFIAFRLLQALGGCVAQVGAIGVAVVAWLVRKPGAVASGA